MDAQLTPANLLPDDRAAALLVGRAWLPQRGGPVPVAVRGDALVDVGALAPTVSQLLELPDPVAALRGASSLPVVAGLADALANADPSRRDASRPWIVAPCDLQPVKACGVTFVESLLERVIEEQARGDASRAQAVRAAVVGVIGEDLAAVRPGSPDAQRLKSVLIEQHAWSQYLEVGIGPDAEVFTKAAPMSSVGCGAEVGIHPGSAWNNPEPEVVLAVDSRGRVRGAALGNDVNLRDFEGRSALLLGKAKDNNGSCAIGPFVRLLDDAFTIDDVRACEVTLRIEGPDGFTLDGASSMARISRDPLELVAHAIGRHHDYPDGMMLFLGTMFAPTKDRFGPGQGFTHVPGDVVSIRTPRLGALVNRVGHTDGIERWRFGIGALIAQLAR